MSFILILITAISLSMDAFSLALIYGTLNIGKKMENKMSIAVGIFHFFMPIIGFHIGKVILSIIKINPEVLAGSIFIVLAIQMFISLKCEKTVKLLTNLLSIILFAFTVSIDSFSVGIGLNAMGHSLYLSSIIFSIVSGLITYIGLKLGSKLGSKFGTIPVLIGGIVLLILGLSHLI